MGNISFHNNRVILFVCCFTSLSRIFAPWISTSDTNPTDKNSFLTWHQPAVSVNLSKNSKQEAQGPERSPEYQCLYTLYFNPPPPPPLFLDYCALPATCTCVWHRIQFKQTLPIVCFEVTIDWNTTLYNVLEH